MSDQFNHISNTDAHDDDDVIDTVLKRFAVWEGTITIEGNERLHNVSGGPGHITSVSRTWPSVTYFPISRDARTSTVISSGLVLD